MLCMELGFKRGNINYKYWLTGKNRAIFHSHLSMLLVLIFMALGVDCNSVKLFSVCSCHVLQELRSCLTALITVVLCTWQKQWHPGCPLCLMVVHTMLRVPRWPDDWKPCSVMLTRRMCMCFALIAHQKHAEFYCSWQLSVTNIYFRW